MTPSRLREVLLGLLKEVWPVFIWGPPGVGKSSLVRDIAAEERLPVLDVRASLLDPTDIRGIPYVSEGRAIWSPPSFLPHDGEGILFLDELNAAPPLVQASLYQLTLDRAVGEYRLPDGWRIVAAGNRAQDSSIVHRMPAALANRFIHLEYEVSNSDWRSWAIKKGINPHITGFLGLRPDLLFDMKKVDRAFPTPRSWHMLSDALKGLTEPKSAVDIIQGIVGEGAAMEFVGYLSSALSEETVKKIIADPEKSEIPEQVGDQYALISFIVHKGNEVAVQKAAGILLHRLPPEFGVLMARDMIRKSARFAAEPNFLKFAQLHKEFLT